MSSGKGIKRGKRKKKVTVNHLRDGFTLESNVSRNLVTFVVGRNERYRLRKHTNTYSKTNGAKNT